MSHIPSVRGMLRSWWRGTPRRAASVAGFGVDGLPHGVGRLPDAAPAALLAQDDASHRAWAPAVVADLLATGPVLALADDAADFEALLCVPALREAHGAGRLRTWLLPAEAQQRLRRDGLAGLLRDCRQAGLHGGASLCVLDANAMLEEATVAELQRLGTQWRRFARVVGRPAALLFPLGRAQGGAEGGIAGMVRSMSGAFTHAAELGGIPELPVLTLHRWDGERGAVFHARYGLEPDGQGALRYGGSFSQGEVPVMVEAPDQFAVYATQASVARQRGVPASWRIVPTLDALEEAARHAVGATVVVDAGGPQQFEAVASLVHRLRFSRPTSLKIIVRETEAKVRANSEQALLRLGATAVVYREVGFSRLLQLIDDCRHQVHTRTVERDYEQALAAFMPVAECGYRPPVRFVQLVRDMLERSSAVGLEHRLVHLQLLPNVAHLDALRACLPQRDGDFVTADAHGLYVFLFACREPDLEAALMHLFKLPLGQLFAVQSSDGTVVGMGAQLDSLAARAQGLPDYGPLLEPVPRVARTVPAPAHGVEAEPAPQLPVAAVGGATPVQALTFWPRPVGRRAASEVTA